MQQLVQHAQCEGFSAPLLCCGVSSVALRRKANTIVPERAVYKLVDACQDGDWEAFGCLYEMYRKKIFSIALRFSGDTSAAMDIAQDSFLKLFSSIRDFRGDSKFEVWVYRLVVNGCLDHIRRTRRLIPMTDEFLDTLRGSADSFAELLRTELQDRVRSAVERLSPDQRIVVMLRYADELSYEEIAVILGCSPGTVASRLNRAHKILHRRLAYADSANKVSSTRHPEG